LIAFVNPYIFAGYPAEREMRRRGWVGDIPVIFGSLSFDVG
jgi:hypothetical protein